MQTGGIKLLADENEDVVVDADEVTDEVVMIAEIDDDDEKLD
jgi:hypothetical protein